MIKKLLLTLLTAPAFLTAFAETEMIFCAGTDSAGRCVGQQTEYRWSGETMTLKLIVLNNDRLRAGKFKIQIENMKNDYKGEVFAELWLTTENLWKTASKNIYFLYPGYYKVSLFDSNFRLLDDAFVTVTER